MIVTIVLSTTHLSLFTFHYSPLTNHNFQKTNNDQYLIFKLLDIGIYLLGINFFSLLTSNFPPYILKMWNYVS